MFAMAVMPPAPPACRFARISESVPERTANVWHPHRRRPARVRLRLFDGFEDGHEPICRHLEELAVRPEAEDPVGAGVNRTPGVALQLCKIQGFVVVERRHQCGNDASDRNALHWSLSVLEME